MNNSNNLFAGHKGFSPEAFEVRRARQIDDIRPDMMEHAFTSVHQASTAPGAFGLVFGQGKMTPDSIAMILAPTGARPTESLTRISSIGKVLCDPTFAIDVFKQIFPNMSQTLNKNQILLTVWDLQTAVAKSLRSSAGTEIQTVVSEILIQLLATGHFIQPAVGWVVREERHQRFPDRNEYLLEGVRAFLTSAMQSVDLRLHLASTRFTPSAVLDDMTQVLRKIGYALIHSAADFKQVSTALWLVQQTFRRDVPEPERLPDSIINNSILAELRANLSFALAASEAVEVNVGLHQGWEYEDALKSAYQTLNLSPRYNEVSIDTAASIYNVTHNYDAQDDLRSAVLSPNVHFTHPMLVGMTAKVRGAALDSTSFMRLPDAEDILGRVVAEAAPNTMTASLHAAMVSIASQVNMREGSSDPRSELLAINVIDELDYVCLAIKASNLTYVYMDAAQRLRLVYSVELKRKRIFADAIPYDSKVITEDAATAILAGGDRTATLALETRTQIMPIEMYDGYFVGDVDDYLVEFDRNHTMRLSLAGNVRTLDVRMLDLLAVTPRESTRMAINYVDLVLYTNFIDALMSLSKWVIASEYIERLPVGEEGPAMVSDGERQLVERQIAHLINSMLARIFTTTAGEQITDKLARLVVRQAPISEQLTLYNTFKREEYRSQVRVKMALLLLVTTGWLDDSVMIPVMKFFEDARFYEYQRGAEITAALKIN